MLHTEDVIECKQVLLWMVFVVKSFDVGVRYEVGCIRVMNEMDWRDVAGDTVKKLDIKVSLDDLQ